MRRSPTSRRGGCAPRCARSTTWPAEAVPIGAQITYRIPLTPNARRFAAGHRIRLVLASDDQDPATPAIMSFRHASMGTSSLNTISSASRLLLPVCAN